MTTPVSRANMTNQSEDITRMDYILTGLESNKACVGYARPTNCSPSAPPTCLPELRRALLDEWCNISQDQIDNLILSRPRRCKACIASSGRHTPY
ncbi:uncharacterized protein TNCV_986901 [Trichonephila clavipes]|nr:uncharacterized protein TNCV_986901 [Trichonephila clavipes]